MTHGDAGHEVARGGAGQLDAAGDDAGHEVARGGAGQLDEGGAGERRGHSATAR